STPATAARPRRRSSTSPTAPPSSPGWGPATRSGSRPWRP
ncbi:MAG: Hypothetical YciO protein, TsaC/YrdC paralog, partial [uncultured Friedmanniella sp.]